MLQQICGDILKKTLINSTNVIILRTLHETHYDVLNLKTTCTSKDIKDSFIKLSKQYHPDINKNKTSHERFLKINEAYNILSKPDSRRNYDLSLVSPIDRSGLSTTRKFYGAVRNPYDDPSFYANRDKRQDAHHRRAPYYGVEGMEKVSNGTVLTICLIFVVLITSIQFLAINHSYSYKKTQLTERSNELHEVWLETREKALKNGNEKQLELLKLRYEENQR